MATYWRGCLPDLSIRLQYLTVQCRHVTSRIHARRGSIRGIFGGLQDISTIRWFWQQKYLIQSQRQDLVPSVSYRDEVRQSSIRRRIKPSVLDERLVSCLTNPKQDSGLPPAVQHPIPPGAGSGSLRLPGQYR